MPHSSRSLSRPLLSRLPPTTARAFMPPLPKPQAQQPQTWPGLSGKFSLSQPEVDQAEVSEDLLLSGPNNIARPYAGHAQIKEVEFLKSSRRVKVCPKDGRPEFAILGRVYGGKSSHINALVRKKEAAVTSKKPGKTQLINHFLVNKSLIYRGFARLWAEL